MVTKGNISKVRGSFSVTPAPSPSLIDRINDERNHSYWPFYYWEEADEIEVGHASGKMYGFADTVAMLVNDLVAAGCTVTGAVQRYGEEPETGEEYTVVDGKVQIAYGAMVFGPPRPA